MKDFDINKRKRYMETSPSNGSLIMRFDLKKQSEKELFEHLEKMSVKHQIPVNRLAKEMVCHVIESDLEKEEKVMLSGFISVLVEPKKSSSKVK